MPARADEVTPGGKGIVGGALLGGEVVTMGESLVGVRSGWAYAIGFLVGAGGGGAAGYAIDQSTSDGRVPTYMLAGGLALVIPALVLTLNATRYMPEEGASEDKAPTGPAAEPGVPGAGVVTPGGAGTPAEPAAPPPTPVPPPNGGVAPEVPQGPHSLLDLHRGTLRVGIPVPDVRPVYTVAEMKTLGLARSEVQMKMPLVDVAF
jgi:hypothetical protein